MKEKRILDNLANVDEEYIFEAIPDKQSKKQLARKKWMLTACAIIAACIGLIFAWKFVGAGTYTATLNNGNEIIFVKNATNMVQKDIAIVGIRDLSEAEEKAVFGNMEADAYVGFKEETDEFIYLEGTVDGFKVIISRYDVAPCTVIEGMEKVSIVNDTFVVAGLWITDANSRGEKTVIAYASFEVDDYTVYIQHSGNADESAEVCNELAEQILKMLEEGKWGFDGIER